MPHFTIAQAIAPGQSMLGWMLNSLGFSSALALFLGMMILGGACYLIVAKHRPAVIAAYMVLLPLPLLVSICGELKGMVASLTVMAASPEMQVTSADLAGAMAASLFSVFATLIALTPSYLVLATGLLFRTARSSESPIAGQPAAI